MNRTLKIIGWSTIVASFLIVCSEVLGLLTGQSTDQLNLLLNAYPQFKTGAMNSMSDLFEYNRIWSIYTIIYFVVAWTGAILFVQHRETGRRIMEIACWVGLLNACIDSVASFLLLKSTEKMMSGLVGGMGLALGQLNPIGLGAIVAGFFLWVIPSVGILRFLRKPELKALMLR